MKINKREIREMLSDAVESALSEPCQEGGMGEGKAHYYYLGSVFSLTPSGKYYAPWATSNLSDCPRCKGKGTTRNTKGDPEEYARLSEKACTLRVATMQEYGAWCNGGWPKERIDEIEEIEKQEKAVKPERTCSWCGGMGSREAWLDSLWWEAVEEIAEDLGAAVTSGEGDPTDVFVVVTCPKCDEEEESEDEEE